MPNPQEELALPLKGKKYKLTRNILVQIVCPEAAAVQRSGACCSGQLA
jgi:hypothetical protein